MNEEEGQIYENASMFQEERHRPALQFPTPKFFDSISSSQRQKKNQSKVNKKNILKLKKSQSSKNGQDGEYSYRKVNFLDHESQPQFSIEKQQFILVDGYHILGVWKNGRLHGHAFIYYPTGEYFQGQFFNGTKVQGLFRFLDGTEYRGSFEKEVFHGMGTLRDTTGRIIRCQWKNGTPINKATIQYPSGDVYIGQVQNFQKDGFGSLFFITGNKYIGYFQKGQITGYGAEYKGEQKIAQGIWRNGILEGTEEVIQILQEIAIMGFDSRNRM